MTFRRNIQNTLEPLFVCFSFCAGLLFYQLFVCRLTPPEEPHEYMDIPHISRN